MINDRRCYQLKAGAIFLCLAIGVAALDLWTKAAIFDLLEVRSAGDPPHVVSQKKFTIIDGCFELEATYNRGAFYGMFGEHTGKLSLLSAVAVLVIVGIFAIGIRQPQPPSLWFAVALGLICAGTLGNLWDRYRLSAVRDWIKWFFVWDGDPKVWPNFNIADSAICVGVGLIILLEVVQMIRGTAPADS